MLLDRRQWAFELDAEQKEEGAIIILLSLWHLNAHVLTNSTNERRLRLHMLYKL